MKIYAIIKLIIYRSWDSMPNQYWDRVGVYSIICMILSPIVYSLGLMSVEFMNYLNKVLYSGIIDQSVINSFALLFAILILIGLMIAYWVDIYIYFKKNVLPTVLGCIWLNFLILTCISLANRSNGYYIPENLLIKGSLFFTMIVIFFASLIGFIQSIWSAKPKNKV